MNTYWPAEPLSSCAESFTHFGSVAELSITASQVRPFSDARSPVARSPMSFSTVGKSCGFVRPRLNSVIVCPRAIAYSTCRGPMKLVPPRMRIFFGAIAPGRFVAAATPRGSAPATLGRMPRPRAPLAVAAVRRKSRRLVAMGLDLGCEEGLERSSSERSLHERRGPLRDEQRVPQRFARVAYAFAVVLICVLARRRGDPARGVS